MGVWALPVNVAACVRNWQLKVDDHVGPFQSSGSNKIIIEQVNFAFIGPHSGGSLRWFPPNHFFLWNAPRSTTCIVVSIPLPPFTSNYRATFRSGSISNRRSILPLFFSHRIKRHVPNSTEHPCLIKRASSHSEFIHDHRCNSPLFPHRQIKWHVLNSTGFLCFNKRAGSQGGVC